MAVLVDTVFDLRTLSVAVGTVVDLKGYLSELNGGDGGGGSFLAVNTDGTTDLNPKGDPLLPDFGLLFPTANSEILLLRQGVNWRAAPFSELAPHAFPSNTTDGDRLTILSTSPTQASWWGAVPTVPKRAPCADVLGTSLGSEDILTIDDLFCAVVGREPTDDAEVFAVYPFLKEGVFLEREERGDWLTFTEKNRPTKTSKECAGRPVPSVGPGGGVPRTFRMTAHLAALQAAIERSDLVPSNPFPLRGEVSIAAHAFRLDRHLIVRKPRRIRLPDASATEQATFEMLRMDYPQNGAVTLIPSWGEFPGAGTDCADGAFCDEQVYGEPVPAFRFDLVASGTTPSFVIPESPATVAPALDGREMFFRLGRTDNDSAEPFVSVWRTVDRVEAVAVGMATHSRVVLTEVLPAVPVMDLAIASVEPEQGQDPTANTCDGINFETGVMRVELTSPLTKALKADNPQFFSVPIWRTVLVWTDPMGSSARVVTRVLRNKVCTGTAVTTNRVDSPVGTSFLRLCVDEKASEGELAAGMTAQWSREAWAFLPISSPDDSRIEGRLHARTAVGETRPTNDIGGAVQAYNCRRIHIEHVEAERVLASGPEARLDRAAILTTTRDATVGTAIVRMPQPDANPDKNFRSWAIDLQHSKDTTVQEARIEQGLGGGVQFEQTATAYLGLDRAPGGAPALDVTLDSLAGSDAPLGPILDQTYTAEDCRTGAVRVAPSETIPPDPNDTFQRSGYALVGITGNPTTRDPEVDLRIRALDLGVDTQLVRPYFLDPAFFGDAGADALVYRDAMGAVRWASQTLETRSEIVPLPTGSTDPLVVVVPGVVRRISALLPVNKRGTGAGLLYHRQGGSALAAGGLAPQQDADADAALQVYTGLGWREYGLLVALPDRDGWTGGEISWNAELLRSNGPGETPPPASVFGTASASLVDIEPSPATPPTTTPGLPQGLQREGFLAGIRLSLTDSTGLPATITGGQARITVAAQYRPVGSTDPFDSFGSQFFVAGPGVVPKPGERFVRLDEYPVISAPASGRLGYWPAGPGIERRLFFRIEPASFEGVDFSASGTGDPTLLVEGLISS